MDKRYKLGKDDFPVQFTKINVVSILKSSEKLEKLEHIFDRVQRTCGVGGISSPRYRKNILIQID